MISVEYLCDAYIDQGRYIGEDPVGYKCMNPARFEVETDKRLICQSCAILTELEPLRLTFKEPWGREYQSKIFKTALEALHPISPIKDLE